MLLLLLTTYHSPLTILTYLRTHVSPHSPTPLLLIHQVDVYSYGVLLAECLTSERPYAGVDPMLTLSPTLTPARTPTRTPTPTSTGTRALTTDPDLDPT